MEAWLDNMRSPWTDEEDKVLIQMWENSKISIEDMCKVFPIRTDEAIRRRAKRLNLPSYSKRAKPEIDLEYLKKLMEPDEI